jgi:NAD(P)-dependent dehydrogenase (short-subunit alcohol dehydrogenase family)
MSELLKGRVAVVTGGASGIGRATAITIAKHGAKAVVVADIRSEPREGGTPTDQLVKEAGAEARFVECNVAKIDDIRRAVAAADEFDGVDLMVNVAGIFRERSFLEVTEEEYEETMNINLKGTYFGCQAAARVMARRDGGSIINISSTGGLRGSARFADYCTAKGGVRLLSYSLADELGPMGIRVNVIHPGIIATQMTKADVPIVDESGTGPIPLGRFGQPQDIANATVYLASDLASFVSGSSLLIDGGKSRGQ